MIASIEVAILDYKLERARVSPTLSYFFIRRKPDILHSSFNAVSNIAILASTGGVQH